MKNKEAFGFPVITVGDRVIIDKGILGTDSGTLESIDEFHAFGTVGTYKSDSTGEIRVFDQTVHKIKPYYE